MELKEYQVFKTQNNTITYVCVSYIIRGVNNISVASKAAKEANCCIVSNEFDIGIARDGKILPMEDISISFILENGAEIKFKKEWMKQSSFRQMLEMAEQIDSYVELS